MECFNYNSFLPRKVRSSYHLPLGQRETPTWPSTGSICCRVARTNTAVFPIPDLAWHRMSIPRMAWGIHSCCTEIRTKRKINYWCFKTKKNMYDYIIFRRLLTFRWMLKTTVDDGTEKLWFQEKVSEPRAVDGHIGTLHLFLFCRRGPTLGGSLGFLVFLVVQKLIINVSLGHLKRKVNSKFNPVTTLHN